MENCKVDPKMEINVLHDKEFEDYYTDILYCLCYQGGEFVFLEISTVKSGRVYWSAPIWHDYSNVIAVESQLDTPLMDEETVEIYSKDKKELLKNGKQSIVKYVEKLLKEIKETL